MEMKMRLFNIEFTDEDAKGILEELDEFKDDIADKSKLSDFRKLLEDNRKL